MNDSSGGIAHRPGDATRTDSWDAGGAAAPVETLPTRIGAYRIQRLLGRGGMGAVYEAEQDRPRRRVALKVMRPRLDADPARLLRRFEFESEVLGRLQHPGIAQIFEAGTLGDDAVRQPFFAMEFVEGERLTAYCDGRRLGVRERLALIADVCDAVQHAHGKGVIHRDLKPDNILVTTQGRTKILDFGVARATDSDLALTRDESGVGSLVGTLPYMSPEQVTGRSADIDTRADVYSLGVVAYELLAGRRPHALEGKPLPDAIRTICEGEPTPLSSVDRVLRGDVETIVAKALEKERDDRYQTAAGLAADIRRYLNDEPISARPRSTWYQARKFAARNKALVGGIAASFVFLVAGIIGVSIALVRAQEAEARQGIEAQRAAGERERAERAQALAESEQARAARNAAQERASNRFMQQMLSFAAPEFSGRRDPTMRQMLDDAAARVERGTLADQPAVETSVRTTIGSAFRLLGEFDKAQAQLERAVEISRTLEGGRTADTGRAVSNLGMVYEDIGRFEDAESLLAESVELLRASAAGNENDLASAIVNYGALRMKKSRLSEAEALFREALAIYQSFSEPGSNDVATALNNLANLEHHKGNLEEAERLFKESLVEEERANSPESLNVGRTLANLGAIYSTLGRLPEAADALDRSRLIMANLLGAEHPEFANVLINLSAVLQSLGRYAEARTHAEEALRLEEKRGEHPDLGLILNNLGVICQETGDLDQADAYYHRALELRRRLLGDHPHVASTLNNLGRLHQARRSFSDAEPLFREALEIRRRTLGEDHYLTAQSLNNLGMLLDDLGQPAEAERLLRQAYEIRVHALGPDHPEVANSLINLGGMVERKGGYDEAEKMYRGAGVIMRAVYGARSREYAITLDQLAGVLEEMQRYADAEPLLRRAIDIREKVFSPDHWLVAVLRGRLGVVLGHLERWSEAESMLTEARDALLASPAARPSAITGVLRGGIDFYTGWHAADPAGGHDVRLQDWTARLAQWRATTRPSSPD